MNRIIAVAFGAVLLPLLALTTGAGLLIGGTANTCTPTPSTPAASGATANNVHAPGGIPPFGPWDTTQTTNAALIVAVGSQLGVPPWGQVIALAAAIQESGLRNLPYGDRDSLGLFQQRPSQGWGTPAQILNPTRAATRFYQALLAVHGWQSLPLAVAANAVQRSAYPSAYAEHEAQATLLYAHVVSRNSQAIPEDLERFVSTSDCRPGSADDLPSGAGLGLPPGFTLPPGTPPAATTAVLWALAQLGTPYSYGGDCTAPHSGSAAHQCDCSSLVMAAYAHAGLRLPRTTFGQVNVGAPVASLSLARPGDLVFVPGSGTAAAPAHVGIYLGGWLLVHAPHTGSTVSLARLAEWSGNVSAIRRVTS